MWQTRAKRGVVKLGLSLTSLVLLLGSSQVTVRADQPAGRNQDDIFAVETRANEKASEWNAESLKLAIELYLKAAEAHISNRSDAKAAKNIRSAARLTIMLNEGRRGLRLIERASALQKTKNPTQDAENLTITSELWLSQSSFDKSEHYREKAVVAATAAGRNDLLARLYLVEAAILLNRQNFPAMKIPLESAVTIFSENGDRAGQADALTELAYCAVLNNDRVKGRELAGEALRIARQNGLLRQQVFALIAFGDANQRMGDWPTAMRAFKEADENFPHHVDLYERAILVNRMGSFYLTFGDLDNAMQLFLASHRLFESLGKTSACAELLSMVGEIAALQGDFDNAIAYFRQSARFADKAGTVIATGTLNQKIGEAQLGQGNLVAAERSLRKALHSYEKLGVNFRTTEVWQTLGMIYEQKGDHERARKLFERSLSFNRVVMNKLGQAQDRYNLARLDQKQGFVDSSLANIDRSLELTESTRNATTSSVLRAGFFSTVAKRYELYISLMIGANSRSKQPDLIAKALQMSERSKARAMLENLSLSQADYYKDASPTLIQSEKEASGLLNAKVNELAQLNGRESAETKKLDAEILGLERKLDEIRAELKQTSPVYSAISDPEPFNAADFQADVLDDRTVLVEFFLGSEQSYLWVVSMTAVDAYILPPRAVIESRVERLRSILKSREIGSGESIEQYQHRVALAEQEYWDHAHGLSNEILGQASDKLAGKRLIIVSDGKLQYFPLGSLPAPNSESNEPMLLGQEVVYQPSASALKLIKTIGASKPAPNKDLLVFADPVFSRTDERLQGIDLTNNALVSTILLTFRTVGSIDKMPRLPASNDEANAIASIVGGSSTTVRSGFAANRNNALSRDITDYRAVHFATHGMINERRPELSGLLLSLYGEDGSPTDGGFIRMQDVYGMDLNADLVVLSACETGVGKDVRGEGLMSLNNAFLQAGARSVVSTLWKVDDVATKELMTEFYRGITDENLSASAALRRAQIKIYNDPRFTSPFFWAAFTAQGDYLNTVKLSHGRSVSAYWITLLMVITTLGGVYLFRRRLKQRIDRALQSYSIRRP